MTNFKTVQIDPLIIRGGQPDSNDFFFLKNHGVTDIIKLNTEGEGLDIAAEALGMTVHYFPIPTIDQIALSPNKEEIHNAVRSISLLAAKPANILIHCTHGQDRTGLVVGCYRVWHQHWTKEDAWNEMIENGFHVELFGLSLFWEFVV